MSEIYLDNSATTRPCKAAVDKIVEVLTTKFGNPSSLHEKGFEAEKEVEGARRILEKSLRVRFFLHLEAQKLTILRFLEL